MISILLTLQTMASISTVVDNFHAPGFLSDMAEKTAAWIVTKKLVKKTMVISSGHFLRISAWKNRK